MKRTALDLFNKNNNNNNNINQNSLSLPKLSQPINSSTKNSSSNLILKSPNSKFKINNNTKANSTPSFNTIVSTRPERQNNINNNKSTSSLHISNNLSNNNLNSSSDRIDIGTQTEEIFFKMHWSYFIGHFPIISSIPEKIEKVNQNFTGKKLTRKLNSNREKNNSLQFANNNNSNLQNNYFNNLLNGEKKIHGFSGNYNINITLNSLAKGAILLNKLPIKKPINNIYSFNRNTIINNSNGNNNNNNLNQNVKINLKNNTKHRSNYSMNNIEHKNFV